MPATFHETFPSYDAAIRWHKMDSSHLHISIRGKKMELLEHDLSETSERPAQPHMPHAEKIALGYKSGIACPFCGKKIRKKLFFFIGCWHLERAMGDKLLFSGFVDGVPEMILEG